jgi:type VI secretion system protein ImpL
MMTNVLPQVNQQASVSTMVIGSLVMAGIVAAIYGIHRYLTTRRARGGERGAASARPTVTVRDRADRMPRNALVDVWRRFVRAQPRRHRASIKEYPVVLVLGTAGGGKSQLIDAQVDWQAQKKRFLPSVTDDALLQIYIGSRLVVQEVSAALLADDSADARRALKRLWARSARTRPPGVVVVVDAAALGNAAPEELRRQAQLVRGKIDLLQEIHRRPVRISVCLTHMDRFSGFAELADVASRHQLPLAVDLRSLAQRDGRDVQVFGAREDYLGVALAASPAESFARVVELMASSGGLGPLLGAFLAPLCDKSRLAAPPELDKLYFFAPGAEADRVLDRASVAPTPKAQARGVVRRRVWRLAAVGAAVSLYLGLAHANHARKLDAAVTAVAAYQAACQPGAAAANELDRALERADAALHGVESAEHWWPLLELSARQDKRRLAATAVTCTRASYLLPIASHGAVESRELAVYLLGLLYAARDNALGEWIAPRAAAWAADLHVPERAVSAYVYWSAHAWGEPIALQVPAADSDPTLSLKPWVEFFARLQAAYDSQDVGSELAALQARAAQLAGAIDRSHKYPDVSTAMALLPPIAPFDVTGLLKVSRRDEAIQWVEHNRAPLEGVLAMVQDGDLTPAVLGRMTLGAVLAHVNKIMGAAGSEVYAFKLERKYAFGRQRWQELIARATIQIYVRQPGYPFWPRDTPQPQPAAVIDATQPGGIADATQPGGIADATRLATTQPAAAPAPAPGPALQATAAPYHKVVVEGMVRPVLDEFGKKLPSSPIPEADRATLAAYALEQINGYAQKYREALYASYQPYHLAVRTAADLPPAINAMTKPSGGFMRWLRGLAEDADLQNLDTPYLRPLADAVAPLQPIVRLVHPKDAAVNELARYVTLVTKLSRELAGTERSNPNSSAPGNAVFSQPPTQQFGTATGGDPGGGGGGDELSRIMSPVARVAMPMLLQPDTSYLAQTQQWLAEAGITDDIRLPFLEPFERVLDLGVPELERALRQHWARTWSVVARTFEKYPFRRKTRREVEPGEIDAFKEGGAFWQSFQPLAPFCVLRGDGWAQRGPLTRPLALPPGMLGRVNLIVRLARVYFDKDGKRQPLALTVTPLPLPKELDREGYVTMSFLRAGGAAVFGFNQAPTARAFAPTWWGAEGASVGIMFGDPLVRNQPDRAPDQQQDSPTSPWALYHLLEKAQQVGDTFVWSMPRAWTVPREGTLPRELKRRTAQIRFVMRGDAIALHPWTQFGAE